VTPEEAALVDQAIRAAEGCARRLGRSQGQLAALFPLTARSLEGASPEAEDDLDAFMKRFEQLVSSLQDELFKAVAVTGGEDIRSLSRRDVTELMERLGALPSAARFRELVAVRNRIAHVYPDQPERQASNLNEAFVAIGDLLAASERACHYLRERRRDRGVPGQR
jgi:uncharacterized protein YutE (UPF0331/DUF86 family)